MLDLVARSAPSKSLSRSRIVTTSRSLSAIKQPGLDLCVWRRAPADGFAAWCSRLARSRQFVIDERGVRVKTFDLSRSLVEVPSGEMKDLWLADLRELMAAYVRLVGDVALRVQLSTIDSRKCPRFHIDNVGLRLLCTYAGPGTEWIEEHQLDREHMTECDLDHAPVKKGGVVEHLQRFDVAVAKGRAFAGNGRFGLVHRSPAVTAGPRIVFTLDTQLSR